MKKRIAILISGRGSNMAALIEAAKDPSYPAEVVAVLSSDPMAEGLRLATAEGIPTVGFNRRSFGKDRALFEELLHSQLRAKRTDLVCLAGFMVLLSPWFVSQWTGRLLNIHPSLLPEFKGLRTHAQALAAGATEHGATVHYVTAETDGGPIVAQESVPVLPGDTEERLAARVLEAEHRLYPVAVRSVLQTYATPPTYQISPKPKARSAVVGARPVDRVL